MAFSVRTDILKEALERVASIISPRSMHAITRNVLLFQQGDILELRATDLEVYISTEVGVLPQGAQSEHVQLATQPKPLLELLRALPAEEVLTFSQEARPSEVGDYPIPTLHVRSSYGEYQFSGVDANEFPSFPAFEGAEGLDFSVAFLQEVIAQTVFAASREESRPALNGVYFHFLPEYTHFVSTDAQALVRLRRTDKILNGAPNLLLPVRALEALSGALQSLHEGDQVRLVPTKEQALFLHPILRLSCRLIDYQFPDYQSVIPNQPPYYARLNKELLRRAIRRLSVFADKNSQAIVFSFEGNTLTLTARDTASHNAATEHLPCEYEGADFKVAFKSNMLHSILEHIEAEDILIRLSTPGRPAVIEPDPQTPPKDLLILVMPLLQ